MTVPKNKITIEIILERLAQKHGGIVTMINPNEYKNMNTKIKFHDKDYGAWDATPASVIIMGKGHKDRSKEKAIKTFQAKYGVNNPQQNKEVKAKSKATYLERTGYSNPSLNPEVQAKKEETSLKNSGYRYNLSNPEKRKEWASERLERTGFKNPAQNPNLVFHKYELESGQTLHSFTKENGLPYVGAKGIYKNFGEEGLINYKNNYKSNSSSLENLTGTILQELNLPHDKFDKEILTNFKYKPDFRLNDNLFLNVDGLYWHSEGELNKRSNAKKYHIDLRLAFESEGKQILQFYEDEIYNKKEIIASIISHRTKKNSLKIMARKCLLNLSIPNKESRIFFNENHLMGRGAATKTMGLYSDNIMVCAMSYKKQASKLEIIRFCSKIGTSVIGGFGKLLNQLIKIAKSEQISHIESFCDMRYATGESYLKMGFIESTTTVGWCWTDTRGTRFNRLKCTAYRNAGGAHVSEESHAKELGWKRIFDAGQRKYIYTIKNPAD